MLALGVAGRGWTIITGSCNVKVAPCPSPALAACDGAAMHLDEMPDDREPEAEAAGLARRSGIRLAKALEDVRQEIGADADAGVADDDLDVRVDALEPHLDPAALRRELDGVGQQVPHDLLQPIGIARDRTDARIEDGLEAHALGVGGRLHGRHGVVDDAGSSTGCTSSRILPETIRDTSSTSSMICVSQRALRSIVSSRAWPSRPSACRRAATANSRGSR